MIQDESVPQQNPKALNGRLHPVPIPPDGNSRPNAVPSTYGNSRSRTIRATKKSYKWRCNAGRLQRHLKRFVLLRNHTNGAAMQPTLCCKGPFASSFSEIADYAVSGTTAPCTTYTRYVRGSTLFIVLQVFF